MAGAKTVVVARCFTGLSLPHPPKPVSQTEGLTELIYMIVNSFRAIFNNFSSKKLIYIMNF
jgi:hypothetical protein